MTKSQKHSDAQAREPRRRHDQPGQNLTVNELTVRTIRLVDDEGRERATLYTTGARTIFKLHGKDGLCASIVTDLQSGETGFKVLDGPGDCLPVYLGRDHFGDDVLELGGADQKGNAHLKLSVEGNEPALRMYDRKDKLRAVLEVGNDPQPHFELFERKKKATATAAPTLIEKSKKGRN